MKKIRSHAPDKNVWPLFPGEKRDRQRTDILVCAFFNGLLSRIIHGKPQRTQRSPRGERYCQLFSRHSVFPETSRNCAEPSWWIDPCVYPRARRQAQNSGFCIHAVSRCGMRIPLRISFAETQRWTRSECRTQAGSGPSPPPKQVALPKMRSMWLRCWSKDGASRSLAKAENPKSHGVYNLWRTLPRDVPLCRRDLWNSARPPTAWHRCRGHRCDASFWQFPRPGHTIEARVHIPWLISFLGKMNLTRSV